jgi:hypothetical protein
MSALEMASLMQQIKSSSASDVYGNNPPGNTVLPAPLKNAMAVMEPAQDP